MITQGFLTDVSLSVKAYATSIPVIATATASAEVKVSKAENKEYKAYLAVLNGV